MRIGPGLYVGRVHRLGSAASQRSPQDPLSVSRTLFRFLERLLGWLA